MGADGSSSGLSKVPYGDSHYSVDVSGNTKLVKGRDGVKEGRKAPVESMIGNRVYAYANKKDILKEIITRHLVERELCSGYSVRMEKTSEL